MCFPSESFNFCYPNKNNFDDSNTNNNALDATDAAIKAVKDAVDRCCFNPFPSNTGKNYVQIKLGVPAVTDIVSSFNTNKDVDNIMGMNLKAIIKSISHLGHIIRIKVSRGGLLCSNDY